MEMILIWRLEACEGDGGLLPVNGQNPFDGIEVLAICPKDEVESVIDKAIETYPNAHTCQMTINSHMIDMFRPLVEANDRIQDYISNHGERLPSHVIRMLSDMDWAVRNFGEITWTKDGRHVFGELNEACD